MLYYLKNLVLNYSGPKLSMMIAGAGVTLAQLQTIPGSSRILHGILLPYSEDMLLNILTGNRRDSYDKSDKFKAVSSEVAEMMAIKARLLTQDSGAVGIGITGALTTNRYRKGKNGGYIAACYRDGDRVKTYYAKFDVPKLTEIEYNKLDIDDIYDLREAEDRYVSKLICDALLGNNRNLYGQSLSAIIRGSKQTVLGAS